MKRRRKHQKPEPDRLTVPSRGKDRPTPERASRGVWGLFETEDAGVRHAKDHATHPIDALEWRGVLSSDQASAARDYEALYRAQCEVAGARDSTTIWEPRGHDETDGPVEERKRYRELCRDLGMIRERRLQWVIIEQREPRPHEIGQLREDLNEAAHFFGYRRRYA